MRSLAIGRKRGLMRHISNILKMKSFHFWFLMGGLALILCGKIAVEYYTYRDVTPRYISMSVTGNGDHMYTYEIAARYYGHGKFVAGNGNVYYDHDVNCKEGVVYTLTVNDFATKDDISDDVVCKLKKKHFQYCGDEQ